MQKRFVTLTAQSSGTPRRRTYQNREQVVCDVVALVGGIVVQGMLSDGPEFWPADALSAAPQAWSGRPITAYHPTGGASTPQVFENDVFGTIFNARYENGALQLEAWLDVQRAAQVGDEAQVVIERVLAGETIAVSIGAWVWLERQSGIAPGGDRYQYIVKSLNPDHLAMGLYRHGGVGACGIDKCGGNRVMALRTNCDGSTCTCGGQLLRKLRGIDPGLLLKALGVDPDDGGNIDDDTVKTYAALHGLVGYVEFDDEPSDANAPPNSYGLPEAQARALGYRPSPPTPAALSAADAWRDPYGLGAKFIRSLYPGLQ